MRIFISYAHEEKEKVDELVQLLSPFHRIWIDSKSIDPGDRWKDEIKKGIVTCQVFLFVASRASCCSAECAEELDIALRLRKPIIPVILEDCHLHPDLAKLQWVDISEDLEEGARSLLKQLQPRPPYFWMGLSLLEGIVIIALALTGNR